MSNQNICRTLFKEGIKEIAAYRVARGEGVSEDFMIKGMIITSTSSYISSAAIIFFKIRKSKLKYTNHMAYSGHNPICPDFVSL